jgi:hypothetical protein
LTQATISRYESGLVEVPREHVAVLAKVLKRPESNAIKLSRMFFALQGFA